MAPELGPLLSWAEPLIDLIRGIWWLATKWWFWAILILIGFGVLIWRIIKRGSNTR